MNIKDHFCLSRHLLVIALYPTQQNWKCLHIRNRHIQSFISQIFGVVRPLGENLNLFSPLGSDAEANSDGKTPKIKLYPV